MNIENGTAFSALSEGVVIGCGGIRKHWTGLGEAWAIYGNGCIQKYVKELLYWSRVVIGQSIKDLDLCRVQASSRVDFPGSGLWLKHLGFEIEGLMSKYNPDGTDAYLFAMVKD